jgi:hypothetical protein
MDAIKVKECFDYLYLNERYLSAGKSEFVRELKTYFNRNKTLSEKQQSALFEIRKYM